MVRPIIDPRSLALPTSATSNLVLSSTPLWFLEPLQGRHLLRQARLGHPELLRGAGEAARAGNRQEGDQVADVLTHHSSTPFIAASGF